MNSAEKIDLVQALLNEEQAYTDLLDDLDKFAKGKDSFEYGLPLYDDNLDHMRLMVKEWLCKLVVEKA